jgi:UDP-glucose 4-epimerase
VADAYLAAGHDVAVVDDLSTGCRANLPAKAQFFQADIADPNSLKAIFQEVRPDVVNHHAAQMDIRRSLREPCFDARVNIIGSLVLLELSVECAVKQFIFASSGGAIYGNPAKLPAAESWQEMPISHYGVAKLAVERYLHAYQHLYGLPFTVLRYANVFGPRQSPQGEAGVVAIFAGQMLRGEVPTIFGDGTKTRDYVFVRDIVEANLLALKKGEGRVLNLGRGIQVADYEVFEAVRRAANFAGEPKYAPRRIGEVEHIALDATAAQRYLGWKPETDFIEGIRQTVEHIRGSVAESQPAQLDR